VKIAEWIADEEKLKGAEIFAAIVTIIAGGIWVYLDGFTGETLAQVMATLGGAIVIVISFLQHQRKQDVTNFITAGSRALEKLQKAYPDILSGPKIFKDDYVPGENTSTQEYKRYLFFQRPVEKGKEKAQFIPVTPFEEAIIEIYVSSKALKIAEISNPSEEAHKEIHEKMKYAVRKVIRELANKEYNGLFEDKGIDSAGKDIDFKDKNLCVALDFYDDKISYKQFEKIVNRIGQVAIETLNKG